MIASLCATLLLAGAMLIAPVPTSRVETPLFNAKLFSRPARVDNPYFPLEAGTTLVYVSPDHAESTEVAVMKGRRTVLGLPCVVVRDRVWVRGVLVEDTYDWFAQDDLGNVWYMGENSTEFKNGVAAGNHGSWEGGVGGAEPGIIMKADPKVGLAYRQEFAKGEAEDMARVVMVNDSVTTPAGAWTSVVRTEEWSPLEPGVVENKFYARGVGLVKERKVRGGKGELRLVAIRKE